MGNTDSDGRTREQGIEFGPLAERLDNYTYPMTSADLIEADGDCELELPNGTQSLRDLFGPLQGEWFDSAEDARQAIFNMADRRAIGRECYSDRTPPAPGENTEWTRESL